MLSSGAEDIKKNRLLQVVQIFFRCHHLFTRRMHPLIGPEKTGTGRIALGKICQL